MDLAIKWQEVLNNPFFNDVPFKVELNKFGQILMSPASNKHGIIQNKTARNIEKEKRNGVVIIECSILTSEGVKVADVAWASDEFIAEFGDQTPYPKAPEICVEIISPANTQAEMTEKTRLYLEKGALEVWMVSLDNELKIFTHTGQIESSKIV
jgi:Uma2 family endonuclease